MWKVVQTQEFNEWFNRNGKDTQFKIVTQVKQLEIFGPALGRPLVDTIKGSQLKNLKELRLEVESKVIRIFFIFDHSRNAVLLIGANKNSSGDKHFYPKMISISEKIYINYLKQVK